MKSCNPRNLFGAVPVGVLFGLLVATAAVAEEIDLAELFKELQEDGRTAEQVITGFQDNEVELVSATVYTVVNGGSIGLAVAYAQAGVCLAPDQAQAQLVGQASVDNAAEDARKAVQAGVVNALSAYTKDQCRELLNQLNNASQAFASPPGSPAGGAPPAVEEEEPISENQ